MPCSGNSKAHPTYTYTSESHQGLREVNKTEAQLSTMAINLRIHAYVGLPSVDDVVAVPSWSALLVQHTCTPAP